MGYREHPAYVPNGRERLAAIVSVPDGEATDLGVVLLGGAITRVNRHRLGVQAARALAENGFPAIRFDYHGVGDSTGRSTFDPDAPFDEDAIAAARFLCDATGLHRVTFVSTCFGGAVAVAAAAKLQEAVAVTSFFPGSGILVPRGKRPLPARTRVRRRLERSRALRAMLERPSVRSLRLRSETVIPAPRLVVNPRFRQDLLTFLRRGEVRFVFGENSKGLAAFRSGITQATGSAAPEHRQRLHLEVLPGARFTWAESFEEQEQFLGSVVRSVERTARALAKIAERSGIAGASP